MSITLHPLKNKVMMRNKSLVQRRLSKLAGQMKTLDGNIHRGGTRDAINASQRDITETIQDLMDIIEREEG